MRPVIPSKQKIKPALLIAYIAIFILCIVGIGMTLYLQFYQDEKIEIAFGITDSEEEDRYNELKNGFMDLFTNDITRVQNETVEVEKISDNFDLVVTAFQYNVNEEQKSISASIPYININTDVARQINQEINDNYRTQAETIRDSVSNEDIIYNISYKSYIQNNIISLVIKIELREGNNSQKIMIQTYNYSLTENRIVTLEEMLENKGISISSAENKIKNEVESVQKTNEALYNQGYSVYQRDLESEMYKIENTEQYFIGQDGMIYVIYAYGNQVNENTSEMDIIIFI